MTVKELIEKLLKMPLDAEIVQPTYDTDTFYRFENKPVLIHATLVHGTDDIWWNPYKAGDDRSMVRAIVMI